MASVTLKNVNKLYGSSVYAVKDASLEIFDKEFLVIVGPSGCGKTSLLRMIAGLEEISAGDIFIGGARVNDRAPKDRDIAMVFQNYALYPHMNVYDNMAFGLKMRKIPRAEIDRRVREASVLLEIEPYLRRKPKELSGGQRQRVAMGRAIVREPKVFLMDEPLSNLDAKFRVQIRAELQKLHRRLGITTIYVTHDQTEAMTLGSRIAIMRDGAIQQVDAPMALYEKPVNRFVAGFIGSPSMNFIPAKILSEGGKLSLSAAGGATLAVPREKAPSLESRKGSEIVLGIRPEDIHDPAFAGQIPQDSALDATVDVVEPMGAEVFIYLNSGGETVIARVNPGTRAAVGEKFRAILDMRKMHAFDKDTGAAI